MALGPGCEEWGMGGMRAWLDGARLHPRSTLVLGVDTLGSGEPVVLTAEGPPMPVRYRRPELALVDRAADRADLPRPERVRLGAWTDPALAAPAGVPAVSIISMPGGAFTDYHVPTDVPERVDWKSVAACTRLALAVAREWSSGP